MRRLLPLLLIAALGVIAPAQALPPQDENAADAFAAMRWRNIGPTRGGRSVAVAGVVGDPQTYYFGGTGGGVWKTTDAGETWTNVSDGFFKTGSVGAIAVSESDPNVVYVGMGEHAVRGVMTSHGDGVYKSTDAGRTWTHMGLAPTRHIARIRIHPRDPDLVYVAAQGAVHGWNEDRGVYRSRDGGVTWDKVLYVNERTGASELSMDMNNPRILYAAMWDHIRRPWIVESGGEGSGIWKSTDGGDTWKEINTGLPETMGKIGVDVSRADSDRVYAIVEAEPDSGGLYRSDDGGASWQHMSADRSIQTRSWYYMEAYADPLDVETVYVLNAPFMKSIDGGRNFTNVRVPHGDNHDLWVNPSDNRNWINANDGGANVSFNAGESWSTQQNQPTAQFYRVAADDQVPYHVYGGQQDNSAIGIASAAPGIIGWEDFYDVSGCESAYIAFDDPANPRYVYGTCIQGDIDVWDRLSDERKPIRAYPEFNLGVNPIHQQYRFNWNNPVVQSPHGGGVIYHAGNVLFRTSDRGQTWEPISPDLTRNDAEKQQIGGGPITNENAGGEVYNTIFYVAESPTQAGVLWTGTDDGLVQLSRDGGVSWQDVTPAAVRELGRGTGEAPGEALINAIEASPHDPAKAYIAVSRYKFNDFTPHFFKTEDWGQTWTSISTGIGADAWARVVREDPERAGLLYGGTELGMYVSFDDGGNWYPWQLNLPIVPITDLKVHHGDLIASTSGRSFWILDDLSPIRGLTDEVRTSAAALLQPRDALLVQYGGGFGFGGPPAAGANPPGGVQVWYWLQMAPEGAVSLEVINDDNDVVRNYRSDAEEDEDNVTTMPAQAGLNRLAWDMRAEGLQAVPDAGVFGSTAGRLVPPGTYRLRLTVGDEVHETSVRIEQPPWRSATAAQYEEQDEFLREVHGLANEMHHAVAGLQEAQAQLDAFVERTAEVEAAAEVRAEAEALRDQIGDWDGRIVQRKTQNFQDIINFENQFQAQVIALASSVDGTVPPVTAGARQRLADLWARWMELREGHEVLMGEIASFNERIVAAGLGGIVFSDEQ